LTYFILGIIYLEIKDSARIETSFMKYTSPRATIHPVLLFVTIQQGYDSYMHRQRSDWSEIPRKSSQNLHFIYHILSSTHTNTVFSKEFSISSLATSDLHFFFRFSLL